MDRLALQGLRFTHVIHDRRPVFRGKDAPNDPWRNAEHFPDQFEVVHSIVADAIVVVLDGRHVLHFLSEVQNVFGVVVVSHEFTSKVWE